MLSLISAHVTVRYLVLSLESFVRDNRFAWTRDAGEAARFASAEEAEVVRGCVPGATGIVQIGGKWFVINESISAEL